MDNALNKDLNRHYIDAAILYEVEIKNGGDITIDHFTNLAFLYWSFAAQENEFNSLYEIPETWSIRGGERFMNTLDDGLLNYPGNVELHFWKQYLPSRLLMTEFSEIDCQNLLQKYETEGNLIPYFFLHLFDKANYKEQVKKLIGVCDALPTAKNLYIRSFFP